MRYFIVIVNEQVNKMSDKFYAVRYQSMPMNIHMLAIFSLEAEAKNYAIYLIEQEQGYFAGNAYTFDGGNFVGVIPADPSNLPHHYNDVELEYINNVIPKV